MPRSALGAIVFASIIAGTVLFPASTAVAAETANSEFVIIRAEDVLRDDLYAGAIKVIVDGEIVGDLIAFAAEEVVVNGSVTGSVLAVSPTVTVNGSVGGSLRAGTGSVVIDGRVEGDVVVAAFNAGLGAGSVVEGEVLAWAMSMEALGSVGELRGALRNLALGGTVERDVDVSVGKLAIVDQLSVGGDLGYRSEAEAEGLEQATVGGVTVEKSPLPPNIRIRALSLFGRLMAVLFLTIAAITVAWGWPQRTSAAIEDMRGAPLRAWARGALVVFSPLILTGVTALIFVLAPPAASFPLLAVFVPLIVAALGLVAALALVAGVPVVGWLGGVIFRKLSLYGAIVAGSAIAGLAWLLPFVGWLVPIVVLPLGLGAWFEGWRSRTAKASEPLEGRAVS